MSTANMSTATHQHFPGPWTADGCLTDVPAREVANDNKPTIGTVVDGPAGPEFAYPYDIVTGNGMLGRVYRQPDGIMAGTLHALPPIIALSGAAGSGKSTVSDFLATRFGYTKTKFAAPLKAMCRAIGMTDAMIEGDEKEAPVAWLCGRTPRYFMQRLGLEFGRDMVGDNFWIGLWEREAAIHGNVVVDDCRFANEAAALRRMGGRVVRLIGRGGIAGGHASEAADFLADEVICNDGSIADLQERVLEVLEGWRWGERYGK